jgi:hypothetical protein
MVFAVESERCAEEDGDNDDEDDDDDDDDDGLLEGFVEAAAAAARAACVTGMCIPRLGSDNDLRRVLYGISSMGAKTANK